MSGTEQDPYAFMLNLLQALSEVQCEFGLRESKYYTEEPPTFIRTRDQAFLSGLEKGDYSMLVEHFGSALFVVAKCSSCNEAKLPQKLFRWCIPALLPSSGTFNIAEAIANWIGLKGA